MKKIDENLDKLSRNRIASFLGMIGTSQSGDVASKLRGMARTSAYQEPNKPASTKGKYGLTPQQIKMFRMALHPNK